MSGTDLAYAPMPLCACYAMSDTDLAYLLPQWYRWERGRSQDYYAMLATLSYCSRYLRVPTNSTYKQRGYLQIGTYNIARVPTNRYRQIERVTTYRITMRCWRHRHIAAGTSGYLAPLSRVPTNNPAPVCLGYLSDLQIASFDLLMPGKGHAWYPSVTYVSVLRLVDFWVPKLPRKR
eukprot:703365-Rhodomonas_salina.2